jgi:hypothetical protein
MKEHKADVIEKPSEKRGRIEPDMVIIPLIDGESILVTKEELERIGREGVIRKYAARFVRER